MPSKVVLYGLATMFSPGIISAGNVAFYRARLATLTSVSLTACPIVQNGITLVAGDRILLTAQASAIENGIYELGAVSGGGTAPLTRAPELANGSGMWSGAIVECGPSTEQSGTKWKLFTAGNARSALIGTDALNFQPQEWDIYPAATNLPDSNQVILTNQGTWFVIQPGTLSANRSLTLSASLIDPIRVRITRFDVTAFTYAVINGGPAAGTLFTFPALTGGNIVVEFDGTNWVLIESDLVSAAATANAFAQRDGAGGAAFTTVTLNDALFPAPEPTPTISQAQSTTGAGVELKIIPQVALTPGTQLGGAASIDLGATVAGLSAGFFLKTNGTTFATFDSFVGYARFAATNILLGGTTSTTVVVSTGQVQWWTAGPNTARIDTIAAAWVEAYQAFVTSITVTLPTGIKKVISGVGYEFSNGQVNSPSVALATTGTFAWAVTAYNAHCIATGNVTINSITGTRDGSNFELEFVPNPTFTLTLSGAVFSTDTGKTQATLTGLCGTAVRIIIRLVNKRGVVYVDDFSGYAA